MGAMAHAFWFTCIRFVCLFTSSLRFSVPPMFLDNRNYPNALIPALLSAAVEGLVQGLGEAQVLGQARAFAGEALAREPSQDY